MSTSFKFHISGLLASPGFFFLFFKTPSISKEVFGSNYWSGDTLVIDWPMMLFCFLGFKGLYGDMDRDPLCHVTDSDCLSLGGSSLLTPIDCLYSMQDSYFTSWAWRLDSVRNRPLSHSTSLSGVVITVSPWTMNKVAEEVGVKTLSWGRGYTVICNVM